MTTVDMQVTNLTADQLADLRDQAIREAGPFVDPRRLRSVVARMAGRPDDWAGAILGHPYAGLRSTRWRELVLLDLACDAEPDPPVSAARMAREEAARRATDERNARSAAEHQATVGEWRQLRDALPVPVIVLHNYTSHRHCESGYVQGRDHIIVQADLLVGRLHRAADEPLCWTPSRAKDLQVFANPLDAITEDRLPTCKACLRTAERIAGAR